MQHDEHTIGCVVCGKTDMTQHLLRLTREAVLLELAAKLVCVYCDSPIVYRFDDPVMHVGCAIAQES